MSKEAAAGSGNPALGCVMLAVLILAMGSCLGGKSGTDSSSPSGSSSASADEKIAGFHCLSGWDGSHREFVDKVKANLRDPGSFEHDETRVTPVANGRHTITMKFGARNGFGGMNRSIAVGDFDHETCAPSEPAIVSQ